MPDPRASRSSTARRSGAISGLLLVVPLVLGARDCERDEPDDDECDGGPCESGGEAGGGAGVGGRGAGTGGGNTGGRGGSNGGGDGCLYGGERYDVGDSFPSDDGCNSCSCTAGGQVACTLRACANACGGLTGLPCRDDQYCSFPPDAICGAADGTGTCEEIPTVCTDQFDPVCGCDDTTYGNACEAAAQGVSVLHPGECDGGDAGSGGSGSGDAGSGGSGSGETCGGIASLECGEPNEFCNYAPSAGGQGCDGTISDAGGVCDVRPQACTREYQPVCGCDRRTYGNDCTANAEGVSVLHEGECTEIDCADIGGHPVDGIGPPAVCPAGETDYGPVRYSNGMIAIEGTICCVP